MIPTLMIGDHIFVNKFTYGPLIPWTDKRLFSRLPPSRADVMVFKFPENKEQDFIKRVIAVPGDTLEAINGRPIINGWLVPHCYVGQFYESHAAELSRRPPRTNRTSP
jgi:signal peptidase I